MNKLCDAPARESFSSIVMNRLLNDVNSLENLVESLHMRLKPVMAENFPVPSTDCDKKEEVYPPLFQDIRNVCYRIEALNSSIENALSRIEL